MALIKYFDYIDGLYVEDPAGVLLGITWNDASGNSIRAILFLMDYSTLQYGREISFYYQKEIQALGTLPWLLEYRNTFKITNDITIDPASTNRRENLRKRKSDPVPLAEGQGQLDYYLNQYYKGVGKVPIENLEPQYYWLADILADLEGQVIENPVGG